jgi:CubicO group peptidase (beta-lactamase class C family)
MLIPLPSVYRNIRPVSLCPGLLPAALLTLRRAGGYFSSTNDMATIGKAILSNKLLKRAQTDRWLKPTGFVEDFSQGVGRPWEIFRLKINDQSVEIYGKGGDCTSPAPKVTFDPNTDQYRGLLSYVHGCDTEFQHRLYCFHGSGS